MSGWLTSSVQRTNKLIGRWWLRAAILGLSLWALQKTSNVSSLIGRLSLDEPLRTILEFFICLIVAYVAIFLFWLVWHPGASAVLHIKNRIHPIRFTWHHNSPIAFSRSGNRYGIYAFSVTGENFSELPIGAIEASITSQTTNEQMPLYFARGQRIPVENAFVEPGQFQMVSMVPEGRQMMTYDEFRNSYQSFTFKFVHKHGSIEKSFSASDVELLIDRGHRNQEKVYAQAKKTMRAMMS